MCRYSAGSYHNLLQPRDEAKKKARLVQQKRTKPPDFARHLYVHKTKKEKRDKLYVTKRKHKTQRAQKKRTKPPESTRNLYVQKTKIKARQVVRDEEKTKRNGCKGSANATRIHQKSVRPENKRGKQEKLCVTKRKNKTQRALRKRTKPPESTRNLYVQNTKKETLEKLYVTKRENKTQRAQNKRTKPPGSTRNLYVQNTTKGKTRKVVRDEARKYNATVAKEAHKATRIQQKSVRPEIKKEKQERLYVTKRKNKTQGAQKKRTKPPEPTRNLYVQKTKKRKQAKLYVTKEKQNAAGAKEAHKPPESTRNSYVQETKN